MLSTVYYPNLYPSENWLRLAALCWDSVYTLRSQRASQPSDEIQQLNEQLGDFLISKDTRELGSKEAVQTNFTNWFTNALKNNVVFPDDGGRLSQGQWYGMFEDKLTFEIIRQLKSEGFLETYPNHKRDNEYTTRVPKSIALHYMSLCAATLADEERADLFADKEVYAETALFNKGRGEITTSVMEVYIPENLASMEISQISDLRNELSSQRLRFQVAVNSLCDEFTKVTSEEKLLSKRKEIVDIATERIDAVKNTYRRANYTGVLKGIGMSLIPGSITSIASMLGTGVFLPAAIVSGLATVTATFLIEKEKAKEDKFNNNWSYVLEVQDRVKRL